MNLERANEILRLSLAETYPPWDPERTKEKLRKKYGNDSEALRLAVEQAYAAYGVSHKLMISVTV